MTLHGNAAVSYPMRSGMPTRTVPWVWDGFLAEGAVTLLSAPEKTGKTTLLSLLLDRRRQGGKLLGRDVRAGRTLLCSEENTRLWHLRQPPLDFGAQLEFHCPIKANPSPRRWRHFINHLLDLMDDPYDLLVVDTVMSFLPSAQNNPRALREALNELRVVANHPAGILLLHQTCATGHRTRGVLRSFADILIDMRTPTGDQFTRRRHFCGVGRYPGTFQHVAAELNAEGTDYLLLPDEAPEAAPSATLETLRQLLRDNPTPLTRQEILARWPVSEPPPSANGLWRALARGCEQNLIVRTGEGTKAEAFRYAVASS